MANAAVVSDSIAVSTANVLFVLHLFSLASKQTCVRTCHGLGMRCGLGSM